MFDIGWSEILMIVAVAVIVVGPKDIPKMLRTVGNYVRKAKSVMRDFQSQLDEVADISELKELKSEVDNIKNFDFDSSMDNMGAFDLDEKPQTSDAPSQKPDISKADTKKVEPKIQEKSKNLSN